MTLGKLDEIARQIIYREARELDKKNWEDWLELYEENAIYWVPAWIDEYRETTNPDTQLSIIYHASRSELEERIYRVKSNKSVAALPLPRTTHIVSNLMVLRKDAGMIEVEFNWLVKCYYSGSAKQVEYYGWSEVTLSKNGDDWLISRKKIHLQNDCVNSVIDFYCL